MIASILAALAAAAAPAPTPAPPTPPGCDTPQSHQFDFWVGAWDVYPTGGGPLVAHSLVEKLYLGCAVRENWQPLKGAPGGSLNAWVKKDGGWRQTWIGGGGAWVEFRGGWDGGAMVIQGDWAGAGPNGADGIVRMTYTPAPDGSVRQFGEISSDGGKTWSVSFDLTYRRSAP